MDGQRVWFERTFGVGTPPTSLPEIVERLRGTPARLVERAGGLERSLLTTRIDGSWSIQEQVGHLMDLESLWAGRVEDLMEGRPQLRPADLENRATWDASHNDVPVGELLAGFDRERAGFMARVESLTHDDLARTALHPRLLQPMTVVDLCFFVAEHDDHHLARITSIRRML